MPWKFVCDLRFHEVLQTTIVRQIMKENEKIEKYSQKPLELHANLYVCLCVCVCVCACVGYHHHHVVPLARISLTLSRHFSLLFIFSGRSSGIHPVSSHMYVLAGHPAFARPYVGVHRSTSLMSSSLLLQQCPACLVCLIWIVFMMGGRWPYSWCFVECCHQDLFNIARNILV